MDEWDAAAPDRKAAAAPADEWDAAAPSGVSVATDTSAAEGSIWRNMLMGGLSGASKIGATILSPFQQAVLAQAKEIQPDLAAQQPTTRADLAQFFQERAQPQSLAFKGGELGAEIAGTAGIGGALGAGAKALGASPAVVSALGSGGLSLGGESLPAAANLALRTGAGAATGALSAGLVNPHEAAAGGVIGAVTPGAAWLAGAAGRGLMNVGGAIAKNVLGTSTGVGPAAVQAAYEAGKAGDTSFLENMRGDASMGDIVEQAKDALGQMRAARGAAYRGGMAAVSGDKTVLDMAPVQQAIAAAPSGMFKGKVVNQDVVNTVQAIKDKVAEWAGSDAATFHTPEGFDQLKQAIGGIRESTQPGTAARTAADQVYNSVKSQIVKQAPAYAQVMSDYEQASIQLNEIQRSLSLGQKTSADTALRKLQSVLRNNVNTNFGNRLASVQALQTQGGASIVPALAGQSMNTWMPRGIAGALETGGAGLATALGHPAALAAAPFASPRLVGEAAYKAGQAAGVARTALPAMGNITPLLANPNLSLSVNDYLNNVLPVKRP